MVRPPKEKRIYKMLFQVKEIKPNGVVIDKELCLTDKTAETHRKIYQAVADNAGDGCDSKFRHKGSKFFVVGV